jgi:hypothetical protein
MSIDETAGMHELFGKFMAHTLPQVPINPSTWWALPYAALTGCILLFACYMFRKNLWRLIAVLCGAACWVTAVGFEHVAFFPTSLNVAVEEGFEMLGATVLLGAFAHFLIEDPT